MFLCICYILYFPYFPLVKCIAVGDMIALGSQNGCIYLFRVSRDGFSYKKLNKIRGSQPLLHLDWSIDAFYLQSVTVDFDLLFCMFFWKCVQHCDWLWIESAMFLFDKLSLSICVQGTCDHYRQSAVQSPWKISNGCRKIARSAIWWPACGTIDIIRIAPTR